MDGANIKLGRNEFVYHDFLKHGGISVPVNGGGAIYINNPYKPETQLGHVTIYFEDCYRFPVYKLGDDEETFKVILTDYYNRLMDPLDDEITIDVFETATHYSLTSGLASTAYNTYITNGRSPRENAERWNERFKSLIEFAGVRLDPKDPLYDEMNNHIWENVRIVQPYAGMYAFACGLMIGLPSSDTHHNIYYLNKPGWAISHEFGHTVDKNGRAWAETTNNMWAMYNDYRLNSDVRDRNGFSQLANNLGPDLSPYVLHTNGQYLMLGDTFIVWWVLEGAHPGYWGNYENLFLAEKSDKNEEGRTILEITERTIYYSCLATGENLTEYFERWGYYYYNDPLFNANNRFNYAQASENFKNLLNKALAAGRIKSTYKKAWYVNMDFFRYLIKHDWKLGDWARCYSQSDKIKPTSFERTANDDGYIINLPPFKNAEAHCCYEVQSFINNKWTVLGVTYTNSFTDRTNYGGATPKYKVFGYDRNLERTGDPGETTPVIIPPEPIVRVCRIGDTYYDTLNAAIQAANAQDTIVLCKSFPSENINIGKELTIVPEEGLTQPIVITRKVEGNLIGIGANNVKIGSKERVSIVFDGNYIRQSGALLRTNNQDVKFENVVFRNNHNTDEGGAIFMGMNGRVFLDGCTIENCCASNGGAINTRGDAWESTLMQLDDVVIRNNTASEKGGGIRNSGDNGFSTIKSLRGLIVENNNAKDGGGIYLVKKVDITGAIIRNNKASNQGAGIYVDCDESQNSQFKGENVQVYDNTNNDGENAVYVKRGRFIVNGGKYSGRIQKTGNGDLKLVNYSSDVATTPDFSRATFVLDLADENGTVLFSEVSSAFKLDSPLNGFNVLYGYSEYANNQIKAFKGKSILTISASDGKSYTIEMPYGELVFNESFEGFPEDYYITSWSTNGNTYNLGDTFYIGQAEYSFSINVEKYCVLKFYGINCMETVKVRKGTNYYTPTETKDKSRVYGWECSDGNYYPYAQKVVVNRDLVFVPSIKNAFTFSVIFHDEAEFSVKDKCEDYTIPSVPAQIGYDIFKHWEVNGEIHQAGDVITVCKTTVARALYIYTPPPNQDKGKKNKAGIIAGSVVAVLVVVAVVVVAVIFVLKKKASKSENTVTGASLL